VKEKLSILVREFLDRVQVWIINFWQTRICFELRHGANIPPWYGLAGYNKLTERMWVLPIGFNYIWGILNWLHKEIAEGIFSRAESYTYKTGRQLGQLAGEQRGYRLGYVDAKNGQPDAVMAALKLRSESPLPYVGEEDADASD
jgi:hypothetical protein